jgi:hypothetical protein
MAMNEDVLMANTIAAHNSLKLFPCTSITGTIIEDDILSALDKITNTTHLLKTEIFLMVFTNYLSNQSQHVSDLRHRCYIFYVKQNDDAVKADTIDVHKMSFRRVTKHNRIYL